MILSKRARYGDPVALLAHRSSLFQRRIARYAYT